MNWVWVRFDLLNLDLRSRTCYNVVVVGKE